MFKVERICSTKKILISGISDDVKYQRTHHDELLLYSQGMHIHKSYHTTVVATMVWSYRLIHANECQCHLFLMFLRPCEKCF